MATTLELYTRSELTRFAHRDLAEGESRPEVGDIVDLFPGKPGWADAPKATVTRITDSSSGPIIRLNVDALDHQVEQIGALMGWQRHRRAKQPWELEEKRDDSSGPTKR